MNEANDMSKIVSDPAEESFLERNIKSRMNRIFKRSLSSVEECEKKLTPSAVRSYNDAFCALDANNDGIISIEELERLLESIGVHVNRQSVLNMMAEVGGQGKFIGTVKCRPYPYIAFVLTHSVPRTSLLVYGHVVLDFRLF